MTSVQLDTVWPINGLLLTQSVCLKKSDLMLDLTHGEQTQMEGADNNSVSRAK